MSGIILPCCLRRLPRLSGERNLRNADTIPIEATASGSIDASLANARMWHEPAICWFIAGEADPTPTQGHFALE